MNDTTRQLAKAITRSPAQTTLKPPAPLSLTRGVIAGVGVIIAGVPTTTVQLAGSSMAVPAEVAIGTPAKTGDTVDVLVAPPRIIVLGPTSPVPTGPGIDSSFYASLSGDGEKTTPGDLTQEGGLTVNSAGDMGIVLNTTAFAGCAGAAILIEDTSSRGIELFGSGPVSIFSDQTAYIGGFPTVLGTEPDNDTSITLFANFPFITIQTSLNPLIAIPFNLLTYSGNPNGTITGGTKGSLLVDVGTPALWIATGTGTAWSKVGP